MLSARTLRSMQASSVSRRRGAARHSESAQQFLLRQVPRSSAHLRARLLHILLVRARGVH